MAYPSNIKTSGSLSQVNDLFEYFKGALLANDQEEWFPKTINPATNANVDVFFGVSVNSSFYATTLPITRAQLYFYFDYFSTFLSSANDINKINPFPISYHGQKLYTLSSPPDTNYNGATILHGWAKMKLIELAMFGDIKNGAGLSDTSLSNLNGYTVRNSVTHWKITSLSYLRTALVRFSKYGTWSDNTIDRPDRPPAVSVTIPSNNTVSITYNTIFTNPSNYEYSFDNGAWESVTSNPFTFLSAIPRGKMRVRLKGDHYFQPSSSITNANGVIYTLDTIHEPTFNDVFLRPPTPIVNLYSETAPFDLDIGHRLFTNAAATTAIGARFIRIPNNSYNWYQTDNLGFIIDKGVYYGRVTSINGILEGGGTVTVRTVPGVYATTYTVQLFYREGTGSWMSTPPAFRSISTGTETDVFTMTLPANKTLQVYGVLNNVAGNSPPSEIFTITTSADVQQVSVNITSAYVMNGTLYVSLSASAPIEQNLLNVLVNTSEGQMYVAIPQGNTFGEGSRPATYGGSASIGSFLGGAPYQNYNAGPPKSYSVVSGGLPINHLGGGCINTWTGGQTFYHGGSGYYYFDPGLQQSVGTGTWSYNDGSSCTTYYFTGGKLQ